MTPLLIAPALLALTTGPHDFTEPPSLGGCSSDRDCEEGWICSPDGICLDSCEVDEDCDGVDGKDQCEPNTKTCVECLTWLNCPSGQCCASRTCQDAVECGPDIITYCNEANAQILLCLDQCTVMHFASCPHACEDNDGNAMCVEPSSSTGEASESGSSSEGSSTGIKPTGGAVSGGCACRTTPTPSSGLGWLLLLGIAILRPRRRPTRA